MLHKSVYGQSPFSRTDLSYGLGYGYAERNVAVYNGGADLDF